MGSGKSLIDQIQDALREMEDTGFLDELADQTDADDDDQEEAAKISDKPEMTRGTDSRSSGSSPIVQKPR